MAELDLAAFAAELKDYYHKGERKSLIYQNRPALARIPKSTDWQGYNWELPLQTGHGQGVGGTAAAAYANKSASKHDRFSIPEVKQYAFGDVDNSLIDRAMSAGGSFVVTPLTNEIDGSFDQFGNDSAMAVFGDGSGVRGVMVTAPSTTTFTVSEDDIVNFERGMTLRFGATTGEAGTNSTVVVSGVNRFSLLVTISAAPGTGALTIGDSVYRDGDVGNKIGGFKTFLHDHSAGAPADLYTMVRSDDPTRKAGLFYDADAASDNVEDAIRNAGARAFREGARSLNAIVLNPLKIAELQGLVESTTNSRTVWNKDESADIELGIRSMMYHTPAGELEVLSDPYCPSAEAYMLDWSTWDLKSIGGEWGRFLGRGRFDQALLANNGATDSVEYRIGGYGNLGCSAPGRNMRIKLS